MCVPEKLISRVAVGALQVAAVSGGKRTVKRQAQSGGNSGHGLPLMLKVTGNPVLKNTALSVELFYWCVGQ